MLTNAAIWKHSMQIKRFYQNRKANSLADGILIESGMGTSISWQREFWNHNDFRLPFQGRKNLNLKKQLGVECSWDRKCSKENSISVTAQGTIFCVHMSVLDILGLKTCGMKKQECVVPSTDSNKMSCWPDLKWIALHSGRRVGAPATLVGWGSRFCRRCLSAARSHGIKRRVQFSPFAQQHLWEQAEHIQFLLDGLWNSY